MMIAARPTTYNGIRMRSRLEATWAAMMDQEGYHWLYEPQAFADITGQYLPDFRIWHDDDPPDDPAKYLEVRPTPEGVYRAKLQMPIIWSSDPKATLLIVIPGQELWWISGSMGDGKKWRRAQMS